MAYSATAPSWGCRPSISCRYLCCTRAPFRFIGPHWVFPSLGPRLPGLLLLVARIHRILLSSFCASSAPFSTTYHESLSFLHYHSKCSCLTPCGPPFRSTSISLHVFPQSRHEPPSGRTCPHDSFYYHSPSPSVRNYTPDGPPSIPPYHQPAHSSGPIPSFVDGFPHPFHQGYSGMDRSCERSQKRYYVVYRGRHCGIFHSWPLAWALTAGYRWGTLRSQVGGFTTFSDAASAYLHHAGDVDPHALFPFPLGP